MKKPMFHVKSWILSIIAICLWGLAILPYFIKNSNFPQLPEWLPPVFGILGLVLIGIAFASNSGELDRESKWYWENRKDEIESTRLSSVNNKKPTVEDLQNIEPGKKYQFRVSYKDKVCDLEVDSGDPDLHLLLDKMTNYKLNNDRHITKTQILAVNNNQIIDTQQRASIGKALLGGLIAGEAGFILGGLSGSSTSVVRNGPNRYTFLVVYDDRAPVTETETEGSKRFQFLLSKLEV